MVAISISVAISPISINCVARYLNLNFLVFSLPLNTLATVVSIEHTHTHTLSIIDSGFKFKAVLQLLLLLMAHSLYPT